MSPSTLDAPVAVALRAAHRRPMAAAIAMSLAAIGVAAAGLAAATDTVGQAIAAVVAIVFLLFAFASVRELAAQRRMIGLAVAAPERIVWVNFVLVRDQRGRELALLTLYDDAGREVRFPLSAAHGPHAHALVREQCRAALYTELAGGYETLHGSWRRSPPDFAAREGKPDRLSP